jgi:hypothetical protein
MRKQVYNELRKLIQEKYNDVNRYPNNLKIFYEIISSLSSN